jgi:hypothetical protein
MESIFGKAEKKCHLYDFSSEEITILRTGVICTVSGNIFVCIQLQEHPSNILTMAFYEKIEKNGGISFNPNDSAMEAFCSENKLNENLLTAKANNLFSFALSEDCAKLHSDTGDMFSSVNNALNDQVISRLRSSPKLEISFKPRNPNYSSKFTKYTGT